MLKFKADVYFEGRGLMLLEDAYYIQSGCTPWYDDGEVSYCAKAVSDNGEHVIVYWGMCDWDNPVCVVHDDWFDFDPDEYEEIEF